MKNIWTQSAEIRNVDNRMDHEEAILQNYHAINDHAKLKNRIKEISQAVIDEFWTPESFTHSEEYCQYMMRQKKFVETAIPRQVVTKNYKEGSLFKFALLAILSGVEFYNNFYTKTFYED